MPARRTARSSDAIAILTADHEKVKKLFKQFESLHEDGDEAEAQEVARKICDELTIHATVEEEIFYPEVRSAIDEDDLMDEAEVEHATAKDLIAQIESMTASDDKYAAKVCVLSEYINHHVREEQSEIFPKAKKAGLDLGALGEKILQRKQDLQSALGIDDDSAPAPHKSVPVGKSRTPRRTQASRA